jgi:hypothetical protein
MKSRVKPVDLQEPRKRDTESMKYFERDWMLKYRRWHNERFGVEPPKVVEETCREGLNSVFCVAMGYTTHIRPTENLLLTLQEIKRGLPREDFFSVQIKDGNNSMEVSYMDDVADALIKSVFLVQGAKVRVSVNGGKSEEFRRRAGWVVANVLGDKSFDYDFGMPKVDEKRKALLDVVK